MTDGNLFKLVTRPKHAFPPSWSDQVNRVFMGAIEQIERSCPNCGLVRITVMEGQGRREYRRFNGAQFADEVEPPCIGTVEIREVENVA